MNAKNLMLLTGVAVVIVTSGASQLANAGIDAGGKPVASNGNSSFSKGSVNKIGGVYVNGVRFNTDNADFIIDRRPGSESELFAGQVVSVVGTIDSDGENGTALTVSYNESVAGPVAKIDVRASRVTVLGQTVIINSNTVFSMASDASSIVHLHKDNEISVSGFQDANGNIVATFIGDSDAGNGLEVTGTISSVGSGNMTFAVNNLQVNYSTANLYDLPSGSPTIGQEVEVAGTRLNASGHLVAENVWAVQPDAIPGRGAIGVVEGYVTRRISWMEFEVNGTRVKTTWQTQFVNSSFFSVNLNRKVEVTGRFNARGELVAEKANFEPISESRRVRQPGPVRATQIDAAPTRPNHRNADGAEVEAY